MSSVFVICLLWQCHRFFMVVLQELCRGSLCYREWGPSHMSSSSSSYSEGVTPWRLRICQISRLPSPAGTPSFQALQAPLLQTGSKGFGKKESCFPRILDNRICPGSGDDDEDESYSDSSLGHSGVLCLGATEVLAIFLLPIKYRNGLTNRTE